jgi:hypothetical protein
MPFGTREIKTEEKEPMARPKTMAINTHSQELISTNPGFSINS